MRRIESDAAGRLPIGNITRKPLSESQGLRVKTDLLDGNSKGPYVVTAAIRGLELQRWGKDNREMIEENLPKYGAILFRNFAVNGAEGFEDFVKDFAGDLLEYRERSSPRHQVQGQIYTSTDYPAHQGIFFHNENSYQQVWPMKIAFYCHTPAQQGGETPIADTREVFRRLSSVTLQRFADRGCLYVRNFDGQFGLPWQDVFQTEQREQVEDYCRRAGMSCAWRGGSHLRTRARRSAITVHPRTGESLWFNHVAFFHYSTLEPTVQQGLLATMSEDDLPSNSYYGDGEPIEPTVLDEIREAYQQASIVFGWLEGDVLLLDNMLMAHSRAPYSGTRKVMVAMAEPFGYALAGA